MSDARAGLVSLAALAAAQGKIHMLAVVEAGIARIDALECELRQRIQIAQRGALTRNASQTPDERHTSAVKAAQGRWQPST